jgi:hypothetical protein
LCVITFEDQAWIICESIFPVERSWSWVGVQKNCMLRKRED